MKKNNNFGKKSLSFLIISIILAILYYITININEIINGVFFYGSIILYIISLILGIIGIIKDKNKLLSIITIIIITVIIILAIYYLKVVLPNSIKNSVDTWLSSWGIN